MTFEKQKVSLTNVSELLHQPDSLICLLHFNGVMIKASKA